MPEKGYREADIVLGAYDGDKTEVFKGARKLLQRGLSYGESISKKCDKNIIAITSSDHNNVKDGDILLVDLNGERVEGRKNLPHDLYLHTGLYRALSEINAIVHTHSTFAYAASCAGKPIPSKMAEIKEHIGGDVMVVECTGIEDVDKVSSALKERKACLIADHGVLAVGKGVDEAIYVAEMVERAAMVHAITKLLST